jgi:virginiamycin B lyase
VVLLTFTVDTVTHTIDLPAYPYAIASGPDGNLWVSAADSVLRVTPAGDITSFPVPHSTSESSITFGSDGNLWLAPIGEVARVTLAGSVSEFLLPINDHYVYRITSGPDGNLWFTQTDSTKGTYQAIGRMTTSGVLTEFDPFPPGSLPYGITPGVDGNLWLTEINAGKVARMKTDGTITEFALQSTASRPFEIISGPDGNLWATERGTNSVARITTSGVVTEFRDSPQHCSASRRALTVGCGSQKAVPAKSARLAARGSSISSSCRAQHAFRCGSRQAPTATSG